MYVCMYVCMYLCTYAGAIRSEVYVCMYVYVSGEDGNRQDPGLFDSCDRPADTGEDQGVSDAEGPGERRCFLDVCHVCMYVCMTWVGGLRRGWPGCRGGDPEDSDSISYQRAGSADRCGGMYVCMYVWSIVVAKYSTHSSSSLSSQMHTYV